MGRYLGRRRIRAQFCQVFLSGDGRVSLGHCCLTWSQRCEFEEGLPEDTS